MLFRRSIEECACCEERDFHWSKPLIHNALSAVVFLRWDSKDNWHQYYWETDEYENNGTLTLSYAEHSKCFGVPCQLELQWPVLPPAVALGRPGIVRYLQWDTHKMRLPVPCRNKPFCPNPTLPRHARCLLPPNAFDAERTQKPNHNSHYQPINNNLE